MEERTEKAARVNSSCEDKSCIHLRATNFDCFKQLIETANDQARQLQETIDELRWFDFDFRFSIQDQVRVEEENNGAVSSVSR